MKLETNILDGNMDLPLLAQKNIKINWKKDLFDRYVEQVFYLYEWLFEFYWGEIVKYYT